MKYKEQSLKKYLDHLSAKIPAPGGGSAGAYAAAMGASLISMVINFTFGKPKYKKFERELKSIFSKSEKLKKEFLNLVDLDIEAYRSRDLEKSIYVPLKLARLSLEAIKFCPELIRKSNVNLISDVAHAAVLLESAFTCATFNIEINLASYADEVRAKKICQEISRNRKKILKIRRDTEEKVGKIIRR